MGRVIEILIGLNALGGIATFLGIRYAGRKARDRVLGREKEEEQWTSESNSPQS